MAHPVQSLGRPDEPLPDTVDVAIIGGGIMGMAAAYHLARLAPLRIAVLERSYLLSGASGRNGGGVRMQWGDADNVRLMMRSIEVCSSLAQELGINLWFRQGGYLFLARREADEARLVRNYELHRQLGAPTRLLSADEARERVPELDVSGVRLAAFNPADGVVFPWPFCWGYATQAIQNGVRVRTHTAVSTIEPMQPGFRLGLSTGESLLAETVINATGAWSFLVNRLLGVELPNRPHRHEILSTEPLKPFLDPLVVDLENGLYFSQSTRGEIVAGITLHDPPGQVSDRVSLGSSLRFLTHLGAAMTRVLPRCASVTVLRQWSGPYDISPDGDAILGPTPGHPGLIQVCGFMGHGFMMAPAVGELLARWIVRAESHPMLERWSPHRFTGGDILPRREDMTIG